MAQAPSEAEVKKLQEKSQKAIDKKIALQQKQGKDFVLPEGGGSGVILEAVWKNLPGKKLNDETAVA